MKSRTSGMVSQLMARLGASLEAARERRRRQQLAAANLKAFRVLRTRPGSLLHR